MRLTVHRPIRAVIATAVVTGAAAAGLVAIGPPAVAAGNNTLNAGQTLASGASLVSDDGRTTFVMQGDGNLVVYGPAGARWQSGSNVAGSRLVAQADGNLVVYDRTNAARWQSGTNSVARVVVQDDGNVVGYASSGAARWQTATTLPPASAGPFSNGPFRAAVQSDGNFVLTFGGSATPDPIWASGTGGRPNAYLVVQGDGNAVIYDGGRPVWQTGTSGNPGARLAVTSDGNLVVQATNGRVLWQTGTGGAAQGLLGGSSDGRFTQTWSHILSGPGAPAALGSPGVGNLDGTGNSVLVGTRGGTVSAFRTGDGSTVPGWPVGTGAAVDSTPAVADSGANAQVYVGVGNAGNQNAGGVAAYTANGGLRWFLSPKLSPDANSAPVGVQSSVAVGDLQTGRDVVADPMGQMGYAVSSNGGALQGFPWFQADTNFSSPALADLGGDAKQEIVMGGDSTAGLAYNRQYANGGFIRIVKNSGSLGGASIAQATKCEYQTNQTVQSSPAVGNFYRGGTAIVVGTSLGTYYRGASDTNKVFALDTNCRLLWTADLGGPTITSPSLVDTDGNGTLEVVTASADGYAYALNGDNGAVIWRSQIAGTVFGSISSIDTNGGRSLLVASPAGVQVLDARSGRITGTLVAGLGFQNTPTVTVDSDGSIGVTISGYNNQNRGVALHYRLNGSRADTVSGAGQWPMFHREPQLRGSTLS